MLKIDLLLLLIALALAQFAAHRDREASNVRIWPQIDEISLAHDTVNRPAPAQLRVQVWTELDCAAPLQTEVRYFPDNIDVQVYRDIPAPADCKAERRPIAVELSLRPGADFSYIIINDQVWARDNEGLYHTLSLAPIFIDSATLSRPDVLSGNRALRFRGSQAVGCDLPLLYAWRDTEDGVLIGVYNAIDPGSACPAVLVEVDETLEFAATELTVSALLSVNAIAIDEMEMEQVSDSDKVLTNIMRVDAQVGASRPARISLDVEGEHPDGCDFPVLVAQSRAGNAINVEIYREVPADVFCPMILRPYKGTIQLEGRFEKGRYSISVNAHSQQLDI